jgi:hypothetical protein
VPFFGPGLCGFGGGAALLIFGAGDGAGVSRSEEGAAEAALRGRPSVLILSAISMAAGVISRELVDGPSFGVRGFFAVITFTFEAEVERVDAGVVELLAAPPLPLMGYAAALSRFSWSIWSASVYVSPLSRFALDATALLCALL